MGASLARLGLRTEGKNPSVRSSVQSDPFGPGPDRGPKVYSKCVRRGLLDAARSATLRSTRVSALFITCTLLQVS
jgi:hypothetical protein